MTNTKLLRENEELKRLMRRLLAMMCDWHYADLSYKEMANTLDHFIKHHSKIDLNDTINR